MKRLVLNIGFAMLGIYFSASAMADAENVKAATIPRSAISLEQGWRFKQDNALVGAEKKNFVDVDWKSVSVPHTWNRVGYYIPEPASHVNKSEDIDKTLGVGWYRLTFTPPASFKGKRSWLQFDAASRTAEVWLNGVKIGEHAGGFSRFRFDVTEVLKPSDANLLVVKTDNSQPALGGPTAHTLPLAGDFFVPGGLYRPVTLIATSPIHIDMLDHGSAGIYATTRSINEDNAVVGVRASVRNDSGAKASASISMRLFDSQGQRVAEHSSAITLGRGTSTTVEQDLNVAKVRLWNGIQDPYLYTLVVELRDHNNILLDQVEQPFGIRQMRIDPERGFILNGRPYPLYGVALHQDLEGKGWAMSEADIAADIDMIRELGANTIRLSHYQHGKLIHDLADKYGLILWDEIPLISRWTLGNEKEAHPRLMANARQQLQELIRQNYNHPSVAVWGIANEVDIGAQLPAFLTGGTNPIPILNELHALAKTEDPTRPTAQANCCEGRLFARDVDVAIVAPAADVSGVNRYFGWYYGHTDDLGPHLDQLRQKRPQQPIAVTEYGAGGATTIHTDDPTGGKPDSRGQAQPEEYQSYNLEQNWAVMQTKPYLWGTWVWNMFDFATTIRQEGDSQDINTKGIVTYDRKIKKDAFFFYKANWSNVPTVHITGRRYIDRAYRVTDVRVYSNAPTTELTLNGKSLGTQTNCPQKTCVWKAVKLNLGENALIASGKFPGRDQQDHVTWQLAPEVAANVRIDSGALVAAAGAPRFGSDTYFESGEARSVDQPANYGKPKKKSPIADAANRGAAATYRAGDFHYRVPLENGRYNVMLTFVEPGAKAGERQFNVVANGKRVLDHLDVVAETGAPLKALVRSFPVRVTSGTLDLWFHPQVGEAIVSSVEISSAAR